jgi:hypothetical protein
MYLPRPIARTFSSSCRNAKVRDHQQLLRDPEEPYGSTREALEHLMAYHVFQSESAGERHDPQGAMGIVGIVVCESLPLPAVFPFSCTKRDLFLCHCSRAHASQLVRMFLS